MTNIAKDFMQGGLNMEAYAVQQKTCKSERVPAGSNASIIKDNVLMPK